MDDENNANKLKIMIMFCMTLPLTPSLQGREGAKEKIK